MLYLFWRPLWAIVLVILAAAAIGVLFQPSTTALVLVALISLGMVHHVRRPRR